MGNISALNVYSRGTVVISHHKKKHDLAYTMKFLKGIELEAF
jgi:hypothetical protein